MKLGIIGHAGAGKSTVFEALTKTTSSSDHKSETRIGTIDVPDPRVDQLSKMYQPKKTSYAKVEYLLPPKAAFASDKNKDQSIWNQVRDCDAFILVIRNFNVPGLDPPNPLNDFMAIEQEMIITDLMVIEKRIERLQKEEKRGKKASPEEMSLLNECKQILEDENVLRRHDHIAQSPLLRGYALITAKPIMVLYNNDDEDDQLPVIERINTQEKALVIRGKLEQEISQMTEEEASEFLSEFNIQTSAMDLVIKESYDILGLISFFTVGEDEVKAWTIRKETIAVDAAGAIHSDIKKGFIRAEIVAYDDLMEAGSYQAARKNATVRLEGKTYEVKDGDIAHFRFNV